MRAGATEQEQLRLKSELIEARRYRFAILLVGHICHGSVFRQTYHTSRRPCLAARKEVRPGPGDGIARRTAVPQDRHLPEDRLR
jgi:hypothetical protein